MAVKKWLWPYTIECKCGHIGPSKQKRTCATTCMGNFKVTDYPPGYFFHVDKLRGRINTCPPCETEVLRTFLALSSSNDRSPDAYDGLPLANAEKFSKQDRITRDNAQSDIILLEEWKLAMPHQEKRVRRLYGDDVLRVTQEYADETDHEKAKAIIKRQVCIAMSDLPPSRIWHRGLVEELGAFCQGCGRDYNFDPRVLEVDHIRPKSDGGLDAYDNLTLLCPPCNRSKSTDPMLENLHPQPTVIDNWISKSWIDQYLARVAEHAEQDKANG